METNAYQILEGAWGVLVPTPLFVSESWSGSVNSLRRDKIAEKGCSGNVLAASETTILV